MAATEITFDHVVEQALQLSPLERIRLIERVLPTLEGELSPKPHTPLRSLYGALAHLGPAPSAEEIDEARREAWANFPAMISPEFGAVADTHAAV